MTEAKDNSSLPLLLSITGAVVAVAVVGWFLLDQQSVTPDAGSDLSVDVQAASSAEPVFLDNPEVPTEIETDSATTSLTDDDKLDVDAELRKARLATDAEILVLPAAQSALFYYSRVLNIDPQHAIARAELDAVLANVSQAVSQHLAAGEYREAYEVAVLVARQAPEHALVVETQTTLDTLTENLVQQSISSAQEGNDEQADDLLAAALALPGHIPDYLNAVRESIAEIRRVREAADRDRTQRAQLAADDARMAWVERTLTAIAAGNLITPLGASAKDLLAERNSWTTERDQLTGELQMALLVTAKTVIDSKRLQYAENLLNAATELAGDATEIKAVRAALESALIEEKSTRAVQVSDLVIVNSAAPRYPQRARERDVTGWVDVHFTVTPRGETTDIKIFNSQPKVTFDRAAMKAVEQWTFEPVEFRGQIISQRAATRLVFLLK